MEKEMSLEQLVKQFIEGKIDVDLYSGKDEDGNNVIVSINDDTLRASTVQKNGWTRVNIYHKDGTVEELYEK